MKKKHHQNLIKGWRETSNLISLALLKRSQICMYLRQMSHHLRWNYSVWHERGVLITETSLLTESHDQYLDWLSQHTPLWHAHIWNQLQKTRPDHPIRTSITSCGVTKALSLAIFSSSWARETNQMEITHSSLKGDYGHSPSGLH
jgi:hypothetical protein